MNKSTTHIAVLITCHNRKEKTLACLTSLFHQELHHDISFAIYLVDDGSTDGTSKAVKDKFPAVNIIPGNGNLYWCGGMRLAWEKAMKSDHDYFLWLNDDTILYTNAVQMLIDTSKKVDGSAEPARSIIVGSTCDPVTGLRTYGGHVWDNGPIPVIPADDVQACDTMNGNIVLIPKIVANSVGNIDIEFSHAIGDTDYGLRARKQGISIWLAPGFQGVCEAGRIPLWAQFETPLLKRLSILHSPKGLPPKEYKLFHERHSRKWVIAVLKLYLKTFFPRLWQRIKK